MNKSASIAKLSQALAKAQAEMPVVRMNATNPFLKNKYADLGAVIETSRPILAKHALSVSQFPTGQGEQIGVTTILMHESGEYLEETIFINASDSKGLSVAQSAGVVISYLRRYSWAAVLGLYADEDTDGHNSNGNGKHENGNGTSDEIITDTIWTAWIELTKRAEAVKISHKTFDRAKVKASVLKDTARELRANVEQAEAQAKAGE